MVASLFRTVAAARLTRDRGALVGLFSAAAWKFLLAPFIPERILHKLSLRTIRGEGEVCWCGGGGGVGVVVSFVGKLSVVVVLLEGKMAAAFKFTMIAAVVVALGRRRGAGRRR